MRALIVGAILAAVAFSPASAATKSCADMPKAVGAIKTPDAPAKMAMNKELAAANTEMGKGDMRKACQHYLNAQKMSGAR
jgi:hypothetical protein